MKTIFTLPFFIFLLVGIITYSCQKEDSEILPNPDLDIVEAMNWYENNVNDQLTLVAKQHENNKIWAKPDWNHSVWNRHQFSVIIEVPLIVQGEFGYATEESYRAFKETGDKRFMISRTSLVIEKKDIGMRGFLMTIIPDKEYLLANDFNGLLPSYMMWQADFCGTVLYHNFDGSYSNGWKIFNGEVTNAIIYKGEKDISVEMSKSCLAYYLINWTLTCETTTKSTTDNCIYTEEWNYLYTICESGGGGDGDYNPIQESPTPNADKIYNLNSTLTVEQKLKLDSAIVEFKNNNPTFMVIWEFLISQNASIKFILNSNTPYQAPAAYYPDSNTIAFRDEYCI